MLLLLVGLGLLAAGAVGALLAGRSPRWATRLGVGGALTGCAAGILPALRVLLGAPSESLRLAWEVPYGAFFVGIDPLSAFFLVPLFGLSALAAVYGAEYLARRRAASSWVFFDLLVVAMALVVVARNAVLFLVAWEAMALASFFLVTYDDEAEPAREAGSTYLVATHLGTAALLALFVLLGGGTGSLDFDRFTPAAGAGPLLVLALVGFGSKAGFMPFHVWLPEAHPAAPSHVSALMSGVMIKIGIYGLMRTLTFLGPPPAWAGWSLVAIGVTSGILGIAFAVAQRDLKRLLAYSSVENVGIIALAFGLGLIGLEVGSPAIAVLGFTGGLLHLVNHAVFKGLLFLAAGAVRAATDTGDLEALGGLQKRMPRTGLAFLIGAVAICGLPPVSGFVGELPIYLAALHATTSLGGTAAVPGLVAIAALALVGGLAVACFTKVIGVVFLGEPRSARALAARDPGARMRTPMEVLAVACVAIGLGSPALVGVIGSVVVPLTRLPEAVVRREILGLTEILGVVSACGVALVVLIAIVAALRWALLSRRRIADGPTWDCGFAEPSATMQYTASSFAEPLTVLFGPVLGTRRRLSPPEGFFPRAAAFRSETPDVCRERVYGPVFAAIERALSGFRWLQHGRVQLYVLYIAVTLLVLFVWELVET
ncbi:MAG TPA: proton-conducting transporter membrane subunit [Candidatus Binatia bacterium]|nr:proton-conducting transporter membrane subunit [Candidatus Binatia bacterium]